MDEVKEAIVESDVGYDTYSRTRKMKPFNEPGALQGFDILKVHEEVRGGEEPPGPAPASELEGNAGQTSRVVELG